jgi:cytochrome c oxidase accessory protein FixG
MTELAPMEQTVLRPAVRPAAPSGEPLLPDEAILSRNEQKAQPLYASRVQIYPKAIDGPIRRIKWATLVVLLGIYYAVPWLRWDRGPGVPDQAILIDLPGRRAYLLWIEIWPQEVYYLAGLMILAALALFLVTSIAGRVWCGYACPQTVWTDLFMMVERWIEGDRNARIRADKAPLTLGKAARKSAKHASWLVISLLTGGAWVMYFKDAPTVVIEFFTGQSSMSVYFFVGLLTTTTYLLAGWAREQVCTYMCPWPRFQAALLDEDSLVVSYRAWRGEPRGKHKKGDSWESRGHCIDCRQCVAVCPTGIDIRDGLQLECIGCGLCIDACDDVMDKVGLPKGLIAFDTERNLQTRAVGQRFLRHIVRPRTVIYAVLIAAIAVGLLWSLGARATVGLNVLHDRNPMFVTLSDGSIRNGYTVKILNKVQADRNFILSLTGLPGAAITVLGRQDVPADHVTLSGRPDEVASYQLFVQMPRDQLKSDLIDFEFVLTDIASGETENHDSVFRGPKP